MTLLIRKNLAVVLIALFFIIAGANTSHAQNNINDAELISVDFPGGTVAEYVAALTKAAGSMNVLISPEAAEFSMPAVKLTKVTVSSAIDLVEGQWTENRDPTVYLDVDHVTQYDSREQRTYRINAKLNIRRSQVREKIQSRVWSISHLIKDDVFDSNLVLAAVEMAIEITKSLNKVDMRFHEATSLLIASGSKTQLDAIEGVLDALMQSSQMNSYKSQSKLEKQLQTMKRAEAAFSQQSQRAIAKLAQLENENQAFRLELQTQMVRFAETKRIMDEREALLKETTSKLRDVQALLDRQLRQAADDDKSGRKDN